MIEIIHRVNDIDHLIKIPKNFGVEIDIRSENNLLVLSHDLDEHKESFKEYINLYNHNLLVANIKESGIENEVIEVCKEKKLKNFFLLDVEFPYLLQNFEEQGDYLSLRYSKLESIETVKNFIGKVRWLWIDTYEDLELDSYAAKIIQNFNTCLVSPSRWGYENKVDYYINKFKKFNITFDAIMVDGDEKNFKTTP